MDKLILKKIAKEWCKGILLANGGDAMGDSIEKGLITEDEATFIVLESHKIAERITKEPYLTSLGDIIEKYYEF